MSGGTELDGSRSESGAREVEDISVNGTADLRSVSVLVIEAAFVVGARGAAVLSAADSLTGRGSRGVVLTSVTAVVASDRVDEQIRRAGVDLSGKLLGGSSDGELNEVPAPSTQRITKMSVIAKGNTIEATKEEGSPG